MRPVQQIQGGHSGLPLGSLGRLMCFPFGAGYFCKVPVAKAITEMQQARS